MNISSKWPILMLFLVGLLVITAGAVLAQGAPAPELAVIGGSGSSFVSDNMTLDVTIGQSLLASGNAEGIELNGGFGNGVVALDAGGTGAVTAINLSSFSTQSALLPLGWLLLLLLLALTAWISVIQKRRRRLS